MAHDIPPVFEGTVEIGETYLRGSWRNKRKTVRAKGAKRGRGTTKQAVFGILCRNGPVWAEVVPDVEASTVADSGYAYTEDLAKIDKQQIQIIVPTQRLASGKEIGEFDKRNFRYDAGKDCYFCPRDEELVYDGLNRKRHGKVYKIKDAETCLRCPAFGKCTTAERGRGVIRLDEEELWERLEREYNLSENQAIYKRRQEKVELVFGHIKRNLGVSSFLLRGFEGVRAEMAILSICFNVRRMISLLGRKTLIEKLKNALQTQCSLVFNLNMEKVGLWS